MIHAMGKSVQITGEAVQVLAEWSRATKEIKAALVGQGIEEDFISILIRTAWEAEERKATR